MRKAWIPVALLLIQFLIWKRLEKAAGFQGMLFMIMSLLLQLMTWKFIPNAERLS
jgi:hypothetical protein